MTAHVHGPALALGVLLALNLPAPTDTTAFLAAAGLGLGIGYSFFHERRARAHLKAFQEWDAIYRVSSLARAEEAERMRDDLAMQVEANTREIRQLQDHYASEVQRLQSLLEAAQRRVDELQAKIFGFATDILENRGYLRPERPPT